MYFWFYFYGDDDDDDEENGDGNYYIKINYLSEIRVSRNWNKFNDRNITKEVYWAGTIYYKIGNLIKSNHEPVFEKKEKLKKVLLMLNKWWIIVEWKIHLLSGVKSRLCITSHLYKQNPK